MAGTLEGGQVSWKERIDDYMSIRGLFLAVIVAGTMAATIILVAYAVSTGQVSDQMTGKMRIPSTHSIAQVTVHQNAEQHNFLPAPEQPPEQPAPEQPSQQPAPEQPSQQPAPDTQPAEGDDILQTLLEPLT